MLTNAISEGINLEKYSSLIDSNQKQNKFVKMFYKKVVNNIDQNMKEINNEEKKEENFEASKNGIEFASYYKIKKSVGKRNYSFNNNDLGSINKIKVIDKQNKKYHSLIKKNSLNYPIRITSLLNQINKKDINKPPLKEKHEKILKLKKFIENKNCVSSKIGKSISYTKFSNNGKEIEFNVKDKNQKSLDNSNDYFLNKIQIKKIKNTYHFAIRKNYIFLNQDNYSQFLNKKRIRSKSNKYKQTQNKKGKHKYDDLILNSNINMFKLKKLLNKNNDREIIHKLSLNNISKIIYLNHRYRKIIVC